MMQLFGSGVPQTPVEKKKDAWDIIGGVAGAVASLPSKILGGLFG